MPRSKRFEGGKGNFFPKTLEGPPDNIIALGLIASAGLGFGHIPMAHWNQLQPYEGEDEDGNLERVETSK